jgi:hypothetical protein
MIEAKEALTRARKQLERVQTASWEPQDPEEAVTWAFYAYENALRALAEARGDTLAKNHGRKAEYAGRMAKQKILSTDAEARLVELNGLRKQVSYGDIYGDLAALDLEDIVSELEAFLDEVDAVIAKSGAP